jgi:hypothetical protein
MKSWSARTAVAAPRRTRGQALIWLLGTMVACVAILYGVFNTAQITVAKQRTVNAADAGALAGATVQARVLNLAAYNNRAMMANEAFLIQMLSIESWLQYFGTTADNFGTVAELIGVFVPPVEAIGQFLDKMGDVADKIHDGLAKANNLIIKAIEVEKKVIYAAHTVVIKAGGLLAEDAASKIVEANRTQWGTHEDLGVEIDKRPGVRAATFALNEKDWLAFTTSYTGNKRTDAKEILLNSRDRFSADRPGAWWTNLNLGLVGTEKRGGSQLKGFDRWETQDTLEVWEKVPCKTGMCKEYQPIGWGRSNADKNGTSGDTWEPRRMAQKFAYEQAESHSGWSGVPQVYDIKDKSAKARPTLGIDFIVATRRVRTATLTTHQMGIGLDVGANTGAADMAERLEADQYTALGKARVFFERPQRGLANDFTARGLWRDDSAKEYGSLFSPYWQARLADLTPAEKIGLMTSMGMVPDKALYTPGGQR